MANKKISLNELDNYINTFSLKGNEDESDEDDIFKIPKQKVGNYLFNLVVNRNPKVSDNVQKSNIQTSTNVQPQITNKAIENKPAIPLTKKPDVRPIPTPSLKTDKQAITGAQSSNPFGDDVQSSSNPFGDDTPSLGNPFENISISNVNKSTPQMVKSTISKQQPKQLITVPQLEEKPKGKNSSSNPFAEVDNEGEALTNNNPFVNTQKEKSEVKNNPIIPKQEQKVVRNNPLITPYQIGVGNTNIKTNVQKIANPFIQENDESPSIEATYVSNNPFEANIQNDQIITEHIVPATIVERDSKEFYTGTFKPLKEEHENPVTLNQNSDNYFNDNFEQIDKNTQEPDYTNYYENEQVQNLDEEEAYENKIKDEYEILQLDKEEPHEDVIEIKKQPVSFKNIYSGYNKILSHKVDIFSSESIENEINKIEPNTIVASIINTTNVTNINTNKPNITNTEIKKQSQEKTNKKPFNAFFSNNRLIILNSSKVITIHPMGLNKDEKSDYFPISYSERKLNFNFSI
jgi:hypothetical protein